MARRSAGADAVAAARRSSSAGRSSRRSSRGSPTTAWRRSCARWPDHFPAFVASLPMNNVPAALEEMDRAIGVLGARGVQIFTNVNGRPLDEPEFFPVFERMTQHHDLPIWMHPARPRRVADYVDRAEVEVRDLAGARLALRDERRRWRAWCSRGCFDKLPGHAHHHPPLRRDDAVLRRARRDAWASSAAAPPTRTTRRC